MSTYRKIDDSDIAPFYHRYKRGELKVKEIAKILGIHSTRIYKVFNAIKSFEKLNVFNDAQEIAKAPTIKDWDKLSERQKAEYKTEVKHVNSKYIL